MNDPNNSELNRESRLERGEIDYKERNITLPFTQNQFKDFMSGLFGKPESIKRKYKGSFNIELSDILNLFYILEDRINQQNKAVLVSFVTTIFFSDDSSVTLNSFESLKNFSEPRNILPIKISIDWQYLIKFYDRKNPEKQEIEIDINTVDYDIVSERDYFQFSENKINITHSIKYTAKTWANDIDMLLETHINNLTKKIDENTNANKVEYIFNAVAPFVGGFVFFLITVIGTFITLEDHVKSKTIDLAKLTSEVSIESNLSYLTEYILKGEMPKLYFFMTIFVLCMFLVSFISALFFFRISSYKLIFSKNLQKEFDNSYILLNKRAFDTKEHHYKIFVKKYQEGRKIFLLTLIITILINVLSNYIFWYLSEKFL